MATKVTITIKTSIITITREMSITQVANNDKSGANCFSFTCIVMMTIHSLLWTNTPAQVINGLSLWTDQGMKSTSGEKGMSGL